METLGTEILVRLRINDIPYSEQCKKPEALIEDLTKLMFSNNYQLNYQHSSQIIHSFELLCYMQFFWQQSEQLLYHVQ